MLTCRSLGKPSPFKTTVISCKSEWWCFLSQMKRPRLSSMASASAYLPSQHLLMWMVEIKARGSWRGLSKIESKTGLLQSIRLFILYTFFFFFGKYVRFFNCIRVRTRDTNFLWKQERNVALCFLYFYQKQNIMVASTVAIARIQ